MRTQQVSIRQPLIVYAMLSVALIAALVLVVAGRSLLRASRRAYRRAATHEIRALAVQSTRRVMERSLAARASNAELEISVLTSSSTAYGLSIDEARRLHEGGNSDEFIVVIAPALGPETYLVGRIDSSIPRSIAFVEVSRMIPFVLMGALACAAFLAFVLGRLLLPLLSKLADVAARPESTRELEVVEDAPDEIRAVAVRFRETVRLLNAERERAEAQKAELERMQGSLIRASKLASVGRLAAGIAHEIGNPLAAIQGYLSLVQSGLTEDERREVLERSLKELGRIHETIRQLLTYARGGEQASEATAPLRTSDILAEAIALVRGHPALRNARVDNRVVGSAENDAEGHGQRLKQVLVNLFLNAAQSRPDDEAQTIVVEKRVSDDAVQLHISDQGPGIPADALEQIFDPFYTTKEPGEGTGLGLAVSRSLMEAMGGDLTVMSTLGEGSRFTVHLGRPQPTT